MTKPGLDSGAVQGIIGLLVVVSGIVVLLATIRRTWLAQTIGELRGLTEAQERQLDFQEKQLKLQEAQLLTVQTRLANIEQDNASLVRRNRELDDRNRSLEERLRHSEERRDERRD